MSFKREREETPDALKDDYYLSDARPLKKVKPEPKPEPESEPDAADSESNSESKMTAMSTVSISVITAVKS
jgi:hypothetical protein